MLSCSLIRFFNVDALAKVMIVLVSFVSIIVGLFAFRYMKGDSKYHEFFVSLGLLVLSVITMAASDNLLVFIAAWGMSNLLLIRLMIHKSIWSAATHSGLLAGKAFFVGYICLVCAFALLYYCTRQTSIQVILHSLDMTSPLSVIAMLLIAVAAISQSAIWPFHCWLISSLNSPTPVSAIMHAGLVNGGGFLLVRFAHLYFLSPRILTFIFSLGLATALIGTVWKLMQNDIKRMLACSTMAQMGFMFAQCGLGLFPAAVAHLCWHGLFKTNLFLSSPSAHQEKRFTSAGQPTITEFLLALLCGIYGSYLFAFVSHKPWFKNDATLLIYAVIFVAAMQLSLNLLQSSPWKRLPITIFFVGIVCALYGYSVNLFEFILSSLDLMRPQELNAFHYLGIILLISLWMIMLFKENLFRHKRVSKILAMFYVRALNASQPNPSTITSYRTQYRYD